MIHTVTYLNLRPQTTAAALKGVERWLRGEGRDGRLFACWYSKLGQVNRILVWHGFETEAELMRRQIALARSPDPYGAAEYLVGLSSNVFHEIDFIGTASVDARGPLFEVRDYVMRLDGLTNLLDLWRAGLPARLNVAPWVTAMYSLTGAAPRVLHIYPWASLEQRSDVRDRAQSVGWPPRDAPKHIGRQEATIYLASALSPLH